MGSDASRKREEQLWCEGVVFCGRKLVDARTWPGLVRDDPAGSYVKHRRKSKWASKEETIIDGLRKGRSKKTSVNDNYGA